MLYTDSGLLARYRDGKVETWHAGSTEFSTCRAMILEDSGWLWVGTDTELAALNPVPVVVYEAGPIKLDFLLASARGGYWLLANGRIQKCHGRRVERDLGAGRLRGVEPRRQRLLAALVGFAITEWAWASAAGCECRTTASGWGRSSVRSRRP